MAQAIRNGSEGRETFNRFFECWLVEQNNNLEQLVQASRNDRIEADQEGYEESVLLPLIETVVKHYEHYYRTKSSCAEHDVLAMLNPSWRSSLEDAFLWIGGWRPSMAFHLLFSKSGLQLEAGLAELLRGIQTDDLGDLSREQLSQVDELQGRTIREERETTEKLAKHQETLADSSMVELSHVATEIMRANERGEEGSELQEDRVESMLRPKTEGLVKNLHKADDLRLNTLKEVLKILTPTQAVHFLIAAAELHLRLHDWGKKRDAMHQRDGGVNINERF